MNPSRPATMTDIARAAGVAQSTVSRALNNHKSDPKTRRRILSIAEKLGYRPNPLVSALMADIKSRRPPTTSSILGFVTCFPSTEAALVRFANYYSGAQAEAAVLGYALDHFWFHEPIIDIARFSRMLHTRNIQGLLIAPMPDELDSLAIDWKVFAPVAIGYSLRQPDISRVAPCHHHNMQLALSKLRELGYRRVGFAVLRQFSSRVNDVWLGGYLAFQSHLPASERFAPFTRDVLQPEELAKWVRRNRLEAVVGESQLGSVLKDSGLNVPEEVAFACLNTTQEGSQSTWAGINEHHEMVGATAIDMIIGQLHRNERGIPLHPTLMLIKGHWVDGPSAPGRQSVVAKEERDPDTSDTS